MTTDTDLTETTTNSTRVRSYDWTRLADLPEFHRLMEDMEALAVACYRDGQHLTRDDFMRLTRDLTSGSEYTDLCETCIRSAHPIAIEVDAAGGRGLTATYRHCGRTWTCWFALNYPLY